MVTYECPDHGRLEAKNVMIGHLCEQFGRPVRVVSEEEYPCPYWAMPRGYECMEFHREEEELSGGE